MSQETMEGEVAVGVMEEKPSLLRRWSFLDSAASLMYDEAVESERGNIPPDFGRSKYLLEQGVTQIKTEELLGTRGYMPPEYISDGTIAMKSDVYSLGVIILSIMSGRRDPVLNQHPIACVYDTAEQDHREVKFSMITASKGGFGIKIGSHTMHAPKYASARHPLVRMMLFARKMLDDKFSCPKSMVPRSILDMIRRTRSVSRCAGEIPVESIGVYDESELGCTAIPSALPPAITTKEDEDAAYHDDAMGGADTLSDMESIVAGFALAASPHEQNKIMNGWDNYTGHMDGVREVTHTKPEHHSIMEAAEKKTAATWVVATAAAHHATGNRDLLSDFTPDQPGRFVESADGAAPMQVLGHGSVITDTVVLHNVLYVPGLTANLVSASQLAELDYTVGFSRAACHIRSAADGTIVGKASVGGDGLYQLDFLQITGAIDKRPVI